MRAGEALEPADELADPRAPKRGREQVCPVWWAGEPGGDERPRRPLRTGAPREVLAGGSGDDVELKHPARERTVGEGVRAQHLAGVCVRGAVEVRVDDERAEPVRGAHAVHLVEERGLSARQAGQGGGGEDESEGNQGEDRPEHRGKVAAGRGLGLPLLGDIATNLPKSYLAVCARTIAASTTIAPASCTPPKVSPSHAQATTAPATGSSIATIPTRVAGR